MCCVQVEADASHVLGNASVRDSGKEATGGGGSDFGSGGGGDEEDEVRGCP